MAIDNVTTSLTTSQAMVHYFLFVSLFALAAGFVFFLSEKEKVIPAYRGTMTTSAIICGVAAVAYYFLTSRYSPDKPFPTDIRYVDWTVTTPLLLIKYPEMLKVRGFSFGLKLIIADIFMIVTGFIGELYGKTVGGHWVPDPTVSNAVNMHYLWGFISTIGYAYILFVLLRGDGKKYAATQPKHIQRGITVMNRYLWSLWGIYPIVYILEGLSASNSAINLDWAQVFSSIGDVINKVGFGLTAYFAVKAMSGDSQYSPSRIATHDSQLAEEDATSTSSTSVMQEGSARTTAGRS